MYQYWPYYQPQGYTRETIQKLVNLQPRVELLEVKSAQKEEALNNFNKVTMLQDNALDRLNERLKVLEKQENIPLPTSEDGY
ncbi:hypothetical protein [Priestia koreensis]|uniref:hypothetical protein n=1 Tax=Priestia koreensis TaxID=284581 RepID=UPI0030167EC9